MVVVSINVYFRNARVLKSITTLLFNNVSLLNLRKYYFAQNLLTQLAVLLTLSYLMTVTSSISMIEKQQAIKWRVFQSQCQKIFLAVFSCVWVEGSNSRTNTKKFVYLFDYLP